MKIVVSSRGSRGDVLPILSIGRALAKDGHEIVACVPRALVPAAEAMALPTFVYEEDVHHAMQTFEAKWTAAKRALVWMAKDLDQQLDVLLAASAGADAIVSSVNELMAPTVAEYRHIRHFRVGYAPIIPATQPPPLQPFQNLPSWGNRVAWRLLNGSIDLAFGRRVDRTRRGLGLKKRERIDVYLAARSFTLLAIDPTLGPPGRGGRFPHAYTGYAFGGDEGSIDPATEAFLDAGEKPLYVGFGSVGVDDPQALTRKVIEAAERVGCRLLIGRGWTGLGDIGPLPPWAAVVGDAPHATLFPRLAAIVHHAGSGTVHNAARAGLPQLGLPQIADQYYWAHRLSRLGLGPKALDPGHLRVADLAGAFHALLHNPAYADRAQSLAAKRNSLGAETAAITVLSHLKAPERYPNAFATLSA